MILCMNFLISKKKNIFNNFLSKLFLKTIYIYIYIASFLMHVARAANF